jgi:Ras-related protein Rab-21
MARSNTLPQVGNDIVIAIAGNKSDLEKNRQVEISAAEEYARSVGAVHFSTSAKTNKGTDDVFLDLSKRIIDQKGAKKASAGAAGAGHKVNIVDDDPAPKAAKSGCC